MGEEMKHFLIGLTAIFAVGVLVSQARAEVIEFPQDELATESVYPKFDHPVSVMQRNVVTANRFDVGAYLGWNTTEPVYNQSKFGVNLGYDWSEDSAISINYAQWMGGLNSTYASAYQTQSLDFSRAPKLKYSLYGHYEWKIFYGKISFTKQTVMNLATYPLFGLGFTSYGSKDCPGVDAGLGQKFYFTKNFALRADLKLQYSQAPSPFISGVKTSNPVPQPSDFPLKWGFNTILDVGVSYLL
jgi:outer membrane beta-barrel protein